MNVMRSPQKVYILKRFLEKSNKSKIATVALCDSFKEACESIKQYQKVDKNACYFFRLKPSSFTADPPCLN